jgi:hypothetical protein
MQESFKGLRGLFIKFVDLFMQPRKNPRQSLGYLASLSPSPDGDFAEIPLFTR